MRRYLQSISDSRDEVMGGDAEEKLRELEEQARGLYDQLAGQLNVKPPGRRLGRFLDSRILPTLSQIGFDTTFCRILFSLAADVWETMAAVPDHVVGLHPNMRSDLEEVREGLLIQADKKMAPDSAPLFLTPQASYDIVQQTLDPANLHRALDEITTPWIILPRACGSLRPDQTHYLPAYLEMIKRETNEEALHIFTRIAIEFLANFTIRFADQVHSKDAVIRLVMAGYEVMFWKLLRSPPRGFEDVRLFEHFLSWMKFSDCHLQKTDLELARMIEMMERHKEHIFPRRTERRHEINDKPDFSRLLIALRHGCLGIACWVRYLSGKPSTDGLPFDRGMAWGALLFDLRSLLDLLTDRYSTQTRRTQYFIRDFIFQLQNAYAMTLLDDSDACDGKTTGLEFIQTKITFMIQQLQRTLAASHRE